MIFHLYSLETLVHPVQQQQDETLTADKKAGSHKPLHFDSMDEDDDNCSVASEATASTACTSASSVASDESSTCSAASGKSVRFDTGSNQRIENDRWSKEEAYENCWLHASDYKRLKSHTTALAREVSRAEDRNRAPYSYQRVILRTYEVCRSVVSEFDGNVLGQEERKHLNRWCEYAPTRLGLEKWAVRHISKERSMRRSEMVETVLGMQESGADAESIKRCSERISRPARLFSRCIAQANASVLESEKYAAC